MDKRQAAMILELGVVDGRFGRYRARSIDEPVTGWCEPSQRRGVGPFVPRRGDGENVKMPISDYAAQRRSLVADRASSEHSRNRSSEHGCVKVSLNLDFAADDVVNEAVDSSTKSRAEG